MLVIRQRRVVNIFAAPLEAQHFRHVSFQFIRGKASCHAAFLVQDESLFTAVLIHFYAGYAIANRVYGNGIFPEVCDFPHDFRSLFRPFDRRRGVSFFFPCHPIPPARRLFLQTSRPQPVLKTWLTSTRSFST